MSAQTSNQTVIDAGTWNIDQSHSAVEFVARHLVVTKVRGRFSTFSGAITIDPADALKSSVNVEIDAASVDTRDEGRDGHLKAADFFDAEAFPKITFASTAVRGSGSDYEVEGDLTIKGVTKSVTLDLEFNGVSADPWGGTRAGFSAKTEINRRDFGLNFDVKLDTGGALVGEKIKIELEVEAVKA